MANEAERRKRNGRFARIWWLPVYCFFSIYLIRADATQAITYWPAWFWAIPPSVIILAFSVSRKKLFWKHLASWLVFAIVFFDSPLSLLKFPYSLPTKEKWFRIASLNCAAGTPAAAKEAIDTDAEIILFQESPSEAQVKSLLPRGYELAYGNDCSVAVRGRLTLQQSSKLDSSATYCDLNGKTIAITSLRLSPPIIELNYLDPSTWSAYTLDRRCRRERLTEIVGSSSPEFAIVGGDFNSGPDDGIERPALDGYTDAFAVAGHGWGGTGTNEFPLVRVDRIWLKGFRVLRAFSVKTINSDHRMVVVDVVTP